MSWKETCPMTEKFDFISTYRTGNYSFAELCRRFSISRKTGYKLLERFEQEGPDGLKERSRANHSPHNATPESIVRKLLDIKYDHKDWGPKKVKIYFEKHEPDVQCPAISTIGEILKKHGLTKPRKKRRRVPPHTEPFKACDAPNRVWSTDFKGQFKVGTAGYCYPLTITDNYSRFILACKGMLSPNTKNVKKWFEYTFREYGLPDAIRSDNGVPFASVSAGGLSALSVWWVKLGIYPERIEPGCPQQNGRHERMHRSLKQATASPPKRSLSAQQRAFNEFMNEFNYERPHEALGGMSPADFYEPSLREYPETIEEYDYPNDFYVRRVKLSGEFKFASQTFSFSKPLAGEDIGLLPISDGIYHIYFRKLKIAIFDERNSCVNRYI